MDTLLRERGLGAVCRSHQWLRLLLGGRSWFGKCFFPNIHLSQLTGDYRIRYDCSNTKRNVTEYLLEIRCTKRLCFSIRYATRSGLSTLPWFSFWTKSTFSKRRFGTHPSKRTFLTTKVKAIWVKVGSYGNLVTITTGPSKDHSQAADYFRRRFEMLNRSTKKQIYVHYTVATDTRLLGHVMNSVSDSILHENVQTLLL